MPGKAKTMKPKAWGGKITTVKLAPNGPSLQSG